MNKLLPIFLCFLIACSSQKTAVNTTTKKKDAPVRKVYKSSYTKMHDLEHTRLNVSFDWKKKQLIGQAVITLHPHFYATDSLVLNARGMNLNEVSLINGDRHMMLKYDYDSMLIRIKLDRTYTKDESFRIFIDYVSKPEEVANGGSAAITQNKGLFFINADSADADTPTQVWTQGETESNSVWFPTIEDPGQKMTQEIYVTVDTAFTTISNGLLLSTIDNKNGTKTDYWKQSLPAAPYLTVLIAGKYVLVKDKWKNISVNYYVDPPYERFARMTYGYTPEMIEFFSNKFGVPFAWEKYSQIVVHDYVSGAMENTTAVVHGTNMQQDSREFKDYDFEDYISHELSHHWFGDLVTCESWSNITLNEGFANYSEYLWREFKYGRDDADRLNRQDLNTYIYTSTRFDPDLIRFDFEFPDDMYDAISYDKGGRVLHMLRKYTGDSAFFASLNDYLVTHKFGTAEVHDLRISFEKITGEDLNWFFNQWFLQGGHPVLNISYNWDEANKTETVTINQKQSLTKNPLYRIPLLVDLYYSGKKERKTIVIDSAEQKFKFKLDSKPDLVNVDAEKMLLCSKTDNKSNAEYIFQYDHAPLFADRFEAVSKVGLEYRINTPEAFMIMRALDDKYWRIRQCAVDNIREIGLNAPDTIKQKLILLATNDSSSSVRESALNELGKYYKYQDIKNAVENALNDESYMVVARAFEIIKDKDDAKAKEMVPKLEKDSGGVVMESVADYYSDFSGDKNNFYKKALRLADNYSLFEIIKSYTKYIIHSSDPTIISTGIDNIIARAKRTDASVFRGRYVSALKEIGTSMDKKIIEKENPSSGDSISKMQSQAEALELKKIKNKLSTDITYLDK